MKAMVVKLTEWIAAHGLKFGMSLTAAALILLLGWLAARWFSNFLRKLMDRKEVDPTLVNFTCNFVYFALLTFFILAALGRLGIQTASFVAVIGAAGLAIGLALQGSLSNFAAGVLLVIFRPIKVGEYVEAAGSSGTVETVQIFTTQLATPDNKTVIIPNAKILDDNITNYTRKDSRRIDLTIGVSYDDDIKQVKKILDDIIEKDGRILENPAPQIRLLELADSSVNFAVRPWVKTGDYWDVYFDLMETIKIRFDKEDISFPFPQLTLHLDEEIEASVDTSGKSGKGK